MKESPEFKEARTVLAQSVVDFIGELHPPLVAEAALVAAFVAVCRAHGVGDLQAFLLLQNALERVNVTPRRMHG